MLAYALSQPHAKVEMINVRMQLRPSPPPNSPFLVTPDVILSVESEEDDQDQNDGIDFSRVRAELDRLLEEGLRESEDEAIDVADEAQDYHTTVYHQGGRSKTTINICTTERLSRSL